MDVQRAAFEVFTNIRDPQQHSEFTAFSKQGQFYLFCYDETLTHRLTKAVPQTRNGAVTKIVAHAERLAAVISEEEFDFDRAKAEVTAVTKL
ncbi:MAG: hypothetical protein HYX94_09335 [Chloroflexi bacterium]|nr:hypothetical protein [Chloroflexota bacterium]